MKTTDEDRRTTIKIDTARRDDRMEKARNRWSSAIIKVKSLVYANIRYCRFAIDIERKGISPINIAPRF